MDSLKYLLVFILVFCALFLIFALIRKNKGSNPGGQKYDERQMIARGKAYQAGFFVMLIYYMLNYCFYTVVGKSWCDFGTGMIIGICLGIVVFAGICIWKDAYTTFDENNKTSYLIVGIVAVANLFSGIFMLIEEGIIIEDGMIKKLSINLVLGVNFAIVLIIALIKYIRDKNTEE